MSHPFLTREEYATIGRTIDLPRYHTLEYPVANTTPRIASHSDLDEALQYIAEGLIDFYRYAIEPCADIDCDVCAQAYADEQG